MAVDIGAVWLDSVFEDTEHSPKLSYRARSKDALGSVEEVFEEHTVLDQSATNGNGYHRQQLVVTSTSGEDQVHFYTGSNSRSASSSGGSPRGQSNSRKTSRSSHGSYSSPGLLTTIRTSGLADGESLDYDFFLTN